MDLLLYAEALEPILSRVRTDVTAVKKPNGKCVWTKQNLSYPRLLKHLDGSMPRGVCPIKAGENTTRLALLDLDSHQGETSPEEMYKAAKKIVQRLNCIDHVYPISFRSSGGRGIHLIMLWEKPQDAYSVRQMLFQALAACNFKNGTGGVLKGEIEVFPKQDMVPIDRFGSQFILPLAGKSEPYDLETGKGLGRDTVLGMEWPISVPVKKIQKQTSQSKITVLNNNLKKFVTALQSIDPDIGYDEWLLCGMALHHETNGSDQGCLAFDEWSSKGYKYQSADEIKQKWASFRGNSRPVTGAYIFQLARESRDREPIDFNNLDDAIQRPFQVIPAHQFASGKQPDWIIKNVLPDTGLAMVFGASGAGKTFFVLDLVATIARGLDWRGNKVKQKDIVYIAAEGIGGFRKRLVAYAKHHQIELHQFRMGIIENAPNIHQNDTEVLIQEVMQHGGASVIVIDTLAQVTPGANENSGEDMGVIINRCKELQKAFDALVILVHHSGKDATRGARGWSGLKAALDTEIEIVQSFNERSAVITKQKDGENNLRFSFKLTTVNLGLDEDGEMVTSCIVEAVENTGKVFIPKTKWQKNIFNAVSRLMNIAGDPVPVGDVIDLAIEDEPLDNVPGEKKKRDSRRDSAMRALSDLVSRRCLTIQDNLIGLPQFRNLSENENCEIAT